ncbi:hypothetical protein HQ531_14310 [bacterium]|nr:hypothetical protein [bacterium]
MALELHAKTYYDDPSIQGGDEHYIGVPKVSFDSTAKVSYSGTCWKMLQGSVYNQPSPLGGYLNVYVILGNCEYESLVGAELTLSCSVSYWGKPPSSGWKSVTWASRLSKSQYSVTEVTN